MTTNFEPDVFEVKFDSQGRIDIEFYHNQALEMRNECLRQIGSGLTQAVKRILVLVWERIACANCQTSH